VSATIASYSSDAACDEAAPAGSNESDEQKLAEKKEDTELTIVPLFGADSDRGVGGGYILSLAGVAPGVEPYLWRLESAGSITFRSEPDGIEVPYLDDYLQLSLPHLIPRTLELTVRLSHTHERQLSYYGLGNAAAPARGRLPSDPYYRYTWTHPRLEAAVGYRRGPLRVGTGIAFTQHSLGVPAESQLRDDAQSADPDVRRLTRLAEDHGVVVFSYGVGWDERDNQVSPQNGFNHALNLELAPGATDGIPYRWLRVNLTLRQYVPLLGDQLMLAARVMVDALAGGPPFYELARAGSATAIGGSKGVRGIPALRYHGMFKTLVNLELRGRFLTFDFWGKQNRLGALAFVDAGRLWADYDRLTALDGDGLGLKLGLGAGLRLEAGKSFVLRADVALSPDSGGFSGYLGPVHTF
jgi:hypothetical protein